MTGADLEHDDRPRWSVGLFDRLHRAGVPGATARDVCDLLPDARTARRAHGVIELLDQAGALSLVLIVVRHGFTGDRLASLLRAVGATDGVRLTLGQISAIRDSLVNPYRRSPPARSLYLETRRG